MRLVGVDIGGTFTDAVLHDSATGALSRSKALSTPGDPARGVLAALAALDVDLAGIDRFVHGLTIGTNAILERKGAEVWLLVTAVFRDVLEIARTNRTRLYDIKTLKPAPLVPRRRVIEIGGRLRADGAEHRPLDRDDLRAAAARLRELAPGALALCFLHSYREPAHEREAAALLREALPDWFFSISSEVLPEMREYERCATAALNAYIGPSRRTSYPCRAGAADAAPR